MCVWSGLRLQESFPFFLLRGIHQLGLVQLHLDRCRLLRDEHALDVNDGVQIEPLVFVSSVVGDELVVDVVKLCVVVDLHVQRWVLPLPVQTPHDLLGVLSCPGGAVGLQARERRHHVVLVPERQRDAEVVLVELVVGAEREAVPELE